MTFISTHTLTWSVTKANLRLSQLKKFQLTRSRGAWPSVFPLMRGNVQISTHTLTWSVTQKWQGWEGYGAFQLTRSRGAWQTGCVAIVYTITFQLTRSRGAWPMCDFVYLGYVGDFNSHAHVERDHSVCEDNLFLPQFQLTRSRGAWLGNLNIAYDISLISTHTLTWSVTSSSTSSSSSSSISTHTLTWSVTTAMPTLSPKP